MELLCCNVAALAVALVYYTWRAYDQARAARQRLLHERVAYLLWVIADRMDSHHRRFSVN
ncbi:MAG TPA: hypothetical protein DDY78_08520 [Planctomycetales bacterium]|jgi:hypothetical protein|nr:hypothetical protein [Planctomycetales bacterium]